MSELWDVKAVAAYLRLSERTVYEKTRRAELPALRVGGRWRFRASDVEAWLDEQKAAAPTRRIGAGKTAGAAVDSPGPASTGPSVSAEPGPEPTRVDLESELDGVADQLERRLRFVALLTTACVARGWQPPVVVGGHALEVYTGGGYATVDIDLVSMSEPLEDILGEWGFGRSGRHWFDESLGLVVEAPGSRLDPGARERVTAVRTRSGTAYVIGVEDLIVDRLSSCVHRKVDDDCVYAQALLREHFGRLELPYLRRRAAAEGVAERLAMIEAADP